MKTLKTLIYLLCLLPFFSIAQTKQGFEVSGHVDGLEEGMTAKLFNRFKDWHNTDWVDSCKVVNGDFKLMGPFVPEQPRVYGIYFVKGNLYLPVDALNGVPLYVENGDRITVSGDIKQPKAIKVGGSLSNDALNWTLGIYYYADRITSEVTHRLMKIHDSIGYNSHLVEVQMSQLQQRDRYLDSVTRNSPRGYEVAFPQLILNIADYHSSFLPALYARLPESIKNSHDGKLAKVIVPFSVGQLFPVFTLLDPEGNKVKSEDFVKKGKLTLVHFWGSNSVEREKYQDELKLVYNKFHDKGLNVIAVSADTVKDDWEFIVHQKKYPWTNVLAEPKGWSKGSLINDVYGEGGHFIPNTTNVLLDDRGTVLAWDVCGPELQYDLEKYLNN